MNNLLKSIVIVLIILLVLMLGKVSYFQKMGRDLYVKTASWIKSIWQGGVNFFNQHILNRVSTEVEKRQEIATKELDAQAQQVGQTLWQKIKDYFSGLFGQKQPASK